MELLKELYCIHSKSGAEKKMKKFIRKYAVERGVKVSYDNGGNMYLVKGCAETYPCVAAHLDQVQETHSKDFEVVETKDILFGYSPSNRQREGLGADDKNGIWIALKCLDAFDVLKVAFFVGEEIGCVGSSRANLSFFGDCRFVIEPDRKGYKDLITMISGGAICSKDFINDCGADKFGFKPNMGLMTDVLELSEQGIGISCINVSCGYYDPHTDDEFTIKEDLLNCLEFVKYAIANCTKVYEHKYEYSYGGYGRYGYGKLGRTYGFDDYYGYGYGKKSTKASATVGDLIEEDEDDMEDFRWKAEPDYLPNLSEYAEVECWLDDVLECNRHMHLDEIYPYISADLDSMGWSYRDLENYYYEGKTPSELKFNFDYNN